MDPEEQGSCSDDSSQSVVMLYCERCQKAKKGNADTDEAQECSDTQVAQEMATCTDREEVACTHVQKVEGSNKIVKKKKYLQGIKGNYFRFKVKVVKKKVNKILNGMANIHIWLKKYNLSLSKDDITSAKAPNWFKDKIIEFYMKLLQERAEKNEKFPSLYAFSTFFLVGLNCREYNIMQNWTKKIDIFARELLIIPVHMKVHWCLSVVDFKYKTISYYDSKGSKNSKCLKQIYRFLRKEHKAKRGTKFNTEGWKLRNVKNVPRQDNQNDCGVFLCTFAEYCSRRAPFDFQQEKMGAFRWKIMYELLTKKLSNDNWIDY